MKTLPMSGRKNAKKATMTKTYLALALLITVLAGNAYGEDEVYYCAEIDKNRFAYDEKSGSYVSTRFTKEDFIIRKRKIENEWIRAITQRYLELEGKPKDNPPKT